MQKYPTGSVCCIAQEAAELIRQYRARGASVAYKLDESPVTEADEAANALIVEALSMLDASIPIISEEGNHVLPQGEARLWLVDPLDGTRSFVRGEDEFTVNIALMENGLPSFGVIAVPMTGELFCGVVGEGAFKQMGEGAPQKIKTRMPPEEGLHLLVSHRAKPPRQRRAFLGDHHVHTRTPMASSLKFCRLAEGAADVYVRIGPTMAWDTAAGQAILEAAGGHMLAFEGEPFAYDFESMRNGAFVAWGR